VPSASAFGTFRSSSVSASQEAVQGRTEEETGPRWTGTSGMEGPTVPRSRRRRPLVGGWVPKRDRSRLGSLLPSVRPRTTTRREGTGTPIAPKPTDRTGVAHSPLNRLFSFLLPGSVLPTDAQRRCGRSTEEPDEHQFPSYLAERKRGHSTFSRRGPAAGKSAQRAPFPAIF
jgi:hypothetical protein